ELIDLGPQHIDMHRLGKFDANHLTADKIDTEVEPAVGSVSNRRGGHDDGQDQREVTPLHEIDVGVVRDQLEQLHQTALNVELARARAAKPQRDQHASEIDGRE